MTGVKDFSLFYLFFLSIRSRFPFSPITFLKITQISTFPNWHNYGLSSQSDLAYPLTFFIIFNIFLNNTFILSSFYSISFDFFYIISIFMLVRYLICLTEIRWRRGVDVGGCCGGIEVWRDLWWRFCIRTGGGMWIGGGGGYWSWGIFIIGMNLFFTNLSLFYVICSIVLYSS